MAKESAARRPNLSEREVEIIGLIRDSGVVNIDQLGKVVSQVAPIAFDPGVAADDYIAKVYSSVIQVWKTSVDFTGLENIASLQTMAREVAE